MPGRDQEVAAKDEGVEPGLHDLTPGHYLILASSLKQNFLLLSICPPLNELDRAGQLAWPGMFTDPLKAKGPQQRAWGGRQSLSLGASASTPWGGFESPSNTGLCTLVGLWGCRSDKQLVGG